MAPFRKFLMRARARLVSFGLVVSEEISCHVAIFNGGALNNISKTTLLTLINSTCGAKCEIFMPKKSYALVTFECQKTALDFVLKLQSSAHKVLGFCWYWMTSLTFITSRFEAERNLCRGLFYPVYPGHCGIQCDIGSAGRNQNCHQFRERKGRI